ncbi:hypothetical protein [Haliscomenobacter sp.]|uniref:hypothetical protein n=1 Tax=Haliscomenobacter sp. TaxID=2717303 RepID=UPI00359470DB
MKQLKWLCFILFALVVNPFLQAQKVIELNFPPSKGEKIDLGGLQKIKKGEFYQIHIKGINLNIYQVGINQQDSVLSKPLSALEFGSFNLDLINKLVSSLSTSVSGIVKNNNTLSLMENSSNVFKPDSLSRLTFEIYATFSLKDSLSKLQMNLDNWRLKFNKILLEAKRNTPNYGNDLNYTHLWSSIDGIRKRLNQISIDVRQNEEEYIKYSDLNIAPIIAEGEKSSNQGFVPQVNSLKVTDENIKKLYAEFGNTLAEVRKGLTADSIYTSFLSLINIDNNRNNSFYSLPLQFMEDRATVKVFISPIDKNSGLPGYETKFSFPSYQKNYWGVGPSLYWAWLKDEVISSVGTVQTDKSITYKIVEEDSRKGEMGTASLLRGGMKFQEEYSVGVHATFGLGLSLTQKVRPRFLLGGGLSFGKTHMLAFDAGLIMGYVDRIGKAVDKNTTYTQPIQGTVSRLGTAVFVAVGYVYKF